MEMLVIIAAFNLLLFKVIYVFAKFLASVREDSGSKSNSKLKMLRNISLIHSAIFLLPLTVSRKLKAHSCTLCFCVL